MTDCKDTAVVVVFALEAFAVGGALTFIWMRWRWGRLRRSISAPKDDNVRGRW